MTVPFGTTPEARAGAGPRVRSADEALSRFLGWLKRDQSSDRASGFLVAPDVWIPLVQFAVVSEGRSLTGRRVLDYPRGTRLRTRSHDVSQEPGSATVAVDHADDDLRLGVRSDLRLRATGAGLAVTGSTLLRNEGSDALVLTFATSLILPAPVDIRTATAHSLRSRNSWLAEHRWVAEPIADALPYVNPGAHHMQQSRGTLRDASSGTWTSGHSQPTAFLCSDGEVLGWEWLGEGAWTWELGESHNVPWIALTGGTEKDHQSTTVLHPGQEFRTPEAVAVYTSAGGLESAVATLGAVRRARRLPHPDNGVPALVYNDYLNTVSGDPEEASTLSLIDAAADAGAETFCIDAGWYDDARDGWWDTIGEWRVAPSRFPSGLAGVRDAAAARGMTLGLWLEPCSIGVRSPLAASAPPGALFRRGGSRYRQAGRHYLNFAVPWVRERLAETVARLVADGVRYFKFDDNVEPAHGDDSDGRPPGTAIGEHERGYHAWVAELRRRHPDVTFETCASGGMKTTSGQLELFQLASLSDQQDFRLIPPIVVNAMISIPVEQCGVWASVQPEMTPGETIFTLSSALAGRLYLSGWLGRLAPEAMSLVSEACDAFRALRAEQARSTPFWPLGIASWTDPWLAVGHRFDDASGMLVVWSRNHGPADVSIDLNGRFGRNPTLSPVFPVARPQHWEEEFADGVLTVSVDGTDLAARVYRIDAAGS